MIDTDKYEGHTPAPWGTKNSPLHVTHLYGGNDTKICSIQTPDGMFAKTKGELKLSRECNTNARLIIDAPLILAAYDKQVRWINDILFRLEKMDEASTGQRLRFLLTVQDELEMMIK